MPSIARRCGKFLLALTLGLVPVAPALAAPTFNVTSSNGVSLFHTIEIDVVAQSFADLYDYQFDLTFDPTKFQFVSASEGPFLATAGATFFFGGMPTAGSIQFVFDTLIGPGPGASGSGVLASFDFTAIGRGASTFALANVLAQDTPGNLINVALTSDRVTVPEPGTLALLALALMGCVTAVRRNPTA
jgi:Cohesin domain/PEP-CTERM motif